MSLTRLALRNTRRQPRRTLLTALAIAVAVATATFMDAYTAGAVDGFFQAFVRIEAGHVKLMPSSAVDRVRFTPLEEGFHDLDRLLDLLDEREDVVAAAPRIRFGVLLEGQDGAVPAFGTALVPSRERNLIHLDDWVLAGRAPRDGAEEVMLGDELAASLDMTLGDTLFFVSTTSYGGLGPGIYQVVGLFHSGMTALDRKTFYVPLAPAQFQLAMEDRALEIALSMHGGMEAAVATARNLQDQLAREGFDDVAAVPWQQQGWIHETLAPVRMFEAILMGLLAVIALTTVINTVLMSVMERTREIGALRALGFTQGTVVRLVLTESMLVGALGTVLGVIAGMALSLWLGHTGIDYSELVRHIDLPLNPVLYPKPSIATAVQSGVFGLIVAAVAAWYPARVATRFEPARALRTE